MALAVILTCCAQPIARATVVKGDCLCGRLPQEKESSAKQSVVSSVGKVRVALFPDDAKEPCCQSLDPVAEAKTKKSGHFKFKSAPPGKYWVVAYVEHHEYQMQVEHSPSKDGACDCSEFFFDDDDLALSAYVHEQGHWLLTERNRFNNPQPLDDLRRTFPNLDYHMPRVTAR
jgi:hypothetical protein